MLLARELTERVIGLAIEVHPPGQARGLDRTGRAGIDVWRLPVP
jgi:hypothetical protein